MMNSNPRLTYVGVCTNFYHSALFFRLMKIGCDAVVIYTMLAMEVYNHNYEIEYDDGLEIDVARRIDRSPSYVHAIVLELVKMEIFDPYLMKKYHILTSQSIQEGYVMSCVKLTRKMVKIPLDRILLPTSQRRKYHLGILNEQADMVVMLVPPAYIKTFKHFGSETAMQQHIDYTGKALVAHRQRVENQAKRAARCALRRKPIDDKQGEKPDLSR